MAIHHTIFSCFNCNRPKHWHKIENYIARDVHRNRCPFEWTLNVNQVTCDILLNLFWSLLFSRSCDGTSCLGRIAARFINKLVLLIGVFRSCEGLAPHAHAPRSHVNVRRFYVFFFLFRAFLSFPREATDTLTLTYQRLVIPATRCQPFSFGDCSGSLLILARHFKMEIPHNFVFWPFRPSPVTIHHKHIGTHTQTATCAHIESKQNT